MKLNIKQYVHEYRITSHRQAPVLSGNPERIVWSTPDSRTRSLARTRLSEDIDLAAGMQNGLKCEQSLQSRSTSNTED